MSNTIIKSGHYLLNFNIKLLKVKNIDLNVYDKNIEETIKKVLLPNIEKLLLMGLKKNNVECETKSSLIFINEQDNLKWNL